MFNNNDRQLSDLPLQVNCLTKRKTSSKSIIDLPRQLPNDNYRQSNKQNILKDQQVNLLDQILTQEDIRMFGDRIISSKKPSKRDDSHLRSIIKKKLFTNNKEKQVQQIKTNKRLIQNKKANKYHQLLSQFYGGPKQFHSKPKQRADSVNKQQNMLNRHQSTKSIHSAQQMNPTIERVRSYSSLKSPKIIIPPSSKKCQFSSEKATYLDLYMQKRGPVLYL